VLLVLTSVVSAGYYLHVVRVMFMKPRPEDAVDPAPMGTITRAVLATTVVLILALGLFPGSSRRGPATARRRRPRRSARRRRPDLPEIFRQYDIRGSSGRISPSRRGRHRPRLRRAARGARHQPERRRRARQPAERRVLRDALVRGLRSTRTNVIDIGVVPTPVLYWALHHLPVQAGSRSRDRTIRVSSTASS